MAVGSGGMAGDAYDQPEAGARRLIDEQLTECGWVVQDYKSANLGAGAVAIREMVTSAGPADYVLFLDRRAVGVIEAKKPQTLTGVEWQTSKYATAALHLGQPITIPLPFLYESTGVETHFTNLLDPEPRARQVFTFHRPETLSDILRRWAEVGGADVATLRQRLQHVPDLADPDGRLWPAQFQAINNLENSLRHGRPRALIQMATGSGKTFTAANISYRLIRHADAKRILFLVDRSNLGEQTLAEFQSFQTPDDGRKFTELYNIQHLSSNRIDPAARVVISTIQRVWSIIKGDEELDPEVDERSSFDLAPSAPVEAVYRPHLPIEEFDIVIVDECHRSIYGLWRQLLDYFDAFTIGLTATPGKQTFGFFNQNLVQEYDHTRAVADGVNVDFDVFRISTEITEQGAKVDAGLVTHFRDRMTREKRLQLLDEDISYDSVELDRRVVAPDQIRTIIGAFKDNLPVMFPGRTEVPKTLFFAKDDSHADDIVQMLREEFGKGNEFAAKITYKAGSEGQKPKELLQAFRNSYNPRIAVTVDMIATGTDVKPLECVVFMRMVRSRNLFEQMKGRGVRVASATDMAVTPDAGIKDRFVLVDAVGVTEANLNDTVPLDRKKAIGFDKLLQKLAYDPEPDLEVVSSIAARIARLERRISQVDRQELETVAGMSLEALAHQLVDAIDPDLHHAHAQRTTGNSDPTVEEIRTAAAEMLTKAVEPLRDNAELRTKLVEIRRSYEQLIDEFTKDKVTLTTMSSTVARSTVDSFRAYIEDHKDEITALQVLYSRPYTQRLTFAQIKELANAIGRPPHRWTPEQLWSAYEQLDGSKVRGSGSRVLTDMVSLVRYSLGQEDELVAYPDLVNQRFSNWLAQQTQAGVTYTPEQLSWLEAIRDHIAASIDITTDDLDYTPFSDQGGIGRASQLFPDLAVLLDHLTEALAA